MTARSRGGSRVRMRNTAVRDRSMARKMTKDDGMRWKDCFDDDDVSSARVCGTRRRDA